MSSWPVNPKGIPEFVVDQEVWIVWGREHYRGTRVLTILFELCAEADYGQDCQLFCTGYRLRAIGGSPDGTFRPNQVYGTEALAHELSRWCPMEGISVEEWHQAIGCPDDDEEALAESELAPCCANISRIRQLLFRCQQDAGLIERERRALEQLWRAHQGGEAPLLDSTTILSKILDQLIRK